jgi:hypothetical protein
MSCCQRTDAAPAAPQARWTALATPPVAAAKPPERLRFAGPRALSLPAGGRRVLVMPGEEVPALSEAERLALWRTGLFEAVD